jgi:predicted Holliday junction resolvase-like endonuclease
MASEIGATLEQFAHILGICPNVECSALFRLSDARPYIKGRRAHTILDEIDAASERIDLAIERLEEQEMRLRAEAKKAGLKQAKHRLKKIDPIFSGSSLDPQDVKVIFNPVEYVVFDGMNRQKLKRVLMLAREPSNTKQERVLKSISDTIRKGNMSFKTMRVLEDGDLQLK